MGRLPGAEVAVTGVTAGSKDFIDAMASRAPLVLGFVLSLAFILMLVTFRSIVVPIKAIVLNLLSVGAASASSSSSSRTATGRSCSTSSPSVASPR